MDDRFDKGMALFRDIYGDAVADGMAAHLEKGEAFGIAQSRWTAEFVFGEIWTRDALTRKARSCTVLGMLIAQGAYDEIVYHTKMGIKNGLSRTELEEIFYTALPYCGFPKAALAKKAMLAAFAELDAA